MNPMDVALIALGGGLGSVGRYSIGLAIGERYHGSFPLGTFMINVTGSFLIGYVSVRLNVHWYNRYGHGAVLNAFVVTGVLGGYTTFSSMQLDAAKLAGDRQGVLAASYLVLSVLTGLLAALLGAALARVQG
jgi:fluoride exporter